MTGEERQVKTIDDKLVSVDQVAKLIHQLSFGKSEKNLKIALMHGNYYHNEDDDDYDDVFYNETLSIEVNQTVLV